MPKIRCQARQQALKVGTAPIPRDEPMNGCGVPEIVQPWLMARSSSACYLRDGAKHPESFLSHEFFDALTIA